MLTSDAYSFGSLFVILGLTVWALVAVGNGAFAAPREKKLLKATEEGDEPARQESISVLNRFMAVEYVLLVAVVVAMIYRWGA